MRTFITAAEIISARQLSAFFGSSGRNVYAIELATLTVYNMYIVHDVCGLHPCCGDGAAQI
jgi:hypothetical protein